MDHSGQDQKQRYAGQRDFHAQSGTRPASLPSWPCQSDPGHPLHRNPYTARIFTHTRSPARPETKIMGP